MNRRIVALIIGAIFCIGLAAAIVQIATAPTTAQSSKWFIDATSFPTARPGEMLDREILAGKQVFRLVFII
jgi:hypothetical protein